MNALAPPSVAAARPTAPALPEYRQRLFSPVGLWRRDQWRIKAYGITHDLARPETDVLDTGVAEAAQRHVLARLAEAETEGSHYSCGFAIIHQGLQANWLVFNWWAYGVICCEALARAPVDDPTKFEIYDGKAMACIWEMVVIEHEKRAWIDLVLKRGGDLDSYLSTWLRPGRY